MTPTTSLSPASSAARAARLFQVLAAHDGLVVAFSGGVDSTFLAAAAVEALGDRAVAATAVSPSLPAAEREEAAALADRIGIRHVEVRTDEVERAAYRRNDADRCFHCKSALFDVLEPLAARLGLGALALGTVTDDLGDHRPGQRAAAERGVVAPLVEAGLSKADVRALSRERGLPTWDKPAAACLASRVAYGLEVTAERLGRIGAAEAWLRSRLGDRVDLRVRDHGDVARVEVTRDRLGDVVALADDLDAVVRDLGWTYATVDLGGFRSGSMNAGVAGGRRGLPVVSTSTTMGASA